MILPIIAYGSNMLRKVANPVESITPQVESLVKDMFETMYNASGVGLAAPQINQSVSLFVVDSTQIVSNEEEPIQQVFINPSINIINEETDMYEEGCLSIPNVQASVERPTEIKVTYFDKAFTQKKQQFEGINARIIQHEYDHLIGKLFIDYLSPQTRIIIKNKLQSIKKGKIKANYPMQ